MLEQARYFAERVRAVSGEVHSVLVETAFRLAVGRQRASGAVLPGVPDGPGSGGPWKKRRPGTDGTTGTGQLCLMFLASDEFLYIR